MREESAQASERQYEISPSQGVRLMGLALMLKMGSLGFRAENSCDAETAAELIADIAQELALQVRQ